MYQVDLSWVVLPRPQARMTVLSRTLKNMGGWALCKSQKRVRVRKRVTTLGGERIT